MRERERTSSSAAFKERETPSLLQRPQRENSERANELDTERKVERGREQAEELRPIPALGSTA